MWHLVSGSAVFVKFFRYLRILDHGNLDAAEADLVASISLAEQQGALSWRLRAEMSLARLRARQGAQNSLEQLAKTYARFSEGFETADLRAARRMLNQPAA